MAIQSIYVSKNNAQVWEYKKEPVQWANFNCFARIALPDIHTLYNTTDPESVRQTHQQHIFSVQYAFSAYFQKNAKRVLSLRAFNNNYQQK